VIEKLKHRHRFGTRSEALDQLELTLEEKEIARAVEASGSMLSKLDPVLELDAVDDLAEHV
jgi:hypothetical protein